ncbi:CPBP family intramembrane glutamic endopeptidase [Chelatococcus asaccharovorans]|uniref:CPBP family intramembrane glutamic endopeptidase n=1 Tax=Chelatococcus asaccharovorans TaxID=28210 RepID=UPI00224C6DF2|nr:CPBP family intramembrane glutamic endopeptidase [Chelatococcus asaccharovorans]CAH1664793.1 conserved membrane hypothetical protein [Chelatococcus asaccharovorans]CAH1682239.1 conserved membrane hypothetical protein [Chelatococcus asaccharovorans]
MHDAEAFAPVSGRHLAATLAVGVGAAALIGTISWWVQSSVVGVSPALKQQIVTVQVYGVLVGALIFGFRPLREPPFVLRGAALRYLLLAPLALAGVVAVTAVLYLLVSPLTGDLASSARQGLAIATDAQRLAGQPSGPWGVALLRGIVVAPLFEELLFRGALLGWLAKHLSVGWAAVSASALFGLMHFYPVVMPYAFLFGLAATWLRLRSGSLLPGFAMHALNSVVLLTAGLLLLK